MDKLKLKWKMFAFLIGFCAILLIILWLLQTVFLKDMYKEIRKSEIEKAIKIVEQNINSPNLQEIFDQLDNDKEILVTMAKDFNPIKKPHVDNNKMKMETITKDKLFILKNGKEINLTFHAIITPVNATIETLKVQLLIITTVMILFSIVLALIISQIISYPIVEINRSTKDLANGNYNTKFFGKGFLEIKELSDTLNIAADQLSKSENVKRELMANISHDLRTPLALIYSYAEIMHDFPEEITSEQTQTIMNEVSRLASLVNDVMDISKLESGSFEIKKEKFNLTKSIESNVKRLSELLNKEGYEICFEFEKEVFIKADEVKIIQAFYNLLINAVNYSGTDKKIVVKQITTNNEVKIKIIDFGEGIETENIKDIWDRYYKIDKNHKRAVTGTGLGLSIVRKILDVHEGNYGVESEIGKGSIFWFSLKLEDK